MHTFHCNYPFKCVQFYVLLFILWVFGHIASSRWLDWLPLKWIVRQTFKQCHFSPPRFLYPTTIFTDRPAAVDRRYIRKRDSETKFFFLLTVWFKLMVCASKRDATIFCSIVVNAWLFVLVYPLVRLFCCIASFVPKQTLHTKYDRFYKLWKKMWMWMCFCFRKDMIENVCVCVCSKFDCFLCGGRDCSR